VFENTDERVIFGDMLDSGSPSDPVFWPIHPTMERLLLRWRMFDGLDEEWPTSGYSLYGDTCTGHAPSDNLEYFSYEGKDDWTNQKLYDFYDPHEDNLPYVYHHFMWSHCSEDTPNDFSI